MSTLIQIESNRRNAQHSTGPATPAGRNAVRLNALKYGIHAKSLLIPGEDPAEFQALVEDLQNTWKPQDSAERQFVDQLTTSSWRLNRLRSAEAQLWADATGKPGVTLGQALESIFRTLDRVGRMIDRIERSIRQTTRDLERLIALRVKAEKNSKAANPGVTEQSQFPTALQREQANWRKQIE
jgi:ABC-type transporter Mla subunit MlaD